MTTNCIWAVLPVKPFRLAKRRLAGILVAGERATLARLMYEDVLDTIASSAELAGAIIVSADEDAAAIARLRGMQAVLEPVPSGIDQAIAVAVRHLAADEHAGILIIPADLPHLSPGAISQAVQALTAPRAVVLVPATTDQGTNMLGYRPAGVMAPCFGRNSFPRHFRAARNADIQPTVLNFPDIGLDIDRIEDLLDFVSLSTATRTHDFLSSLGLHDRLSSLGHSGGRQTKSVGGRRGRTLPAAEGQPRVTNACGSHPVGKRSAEDTVS